MKREIITKNPDHTLSIAKTIGSNLKGNECIEFISDLGGGKTTFTAGLVEGARSTDKVSSPTFTISQKYETQDFSIMHFDFYRLAEPGLVKEELAEYIQDENTVVLVEWADTVSDVLPKERLTIKIDRLKDSENSRKFEFSMSESLNYLLSGIL